MARYGDELTFGDPRGEQVSRAIDPGAVQPGWHLYSVERRPGFFRHE